MKKKKNYFKGKYYKFVTKTGVSLALIDADTQNGRVIQIITEEDSYLINDPNQVTIKENLINFDISQKDLTIKGYLSISELHPLKKDVMGCLRNMNIECKHNIYSMYHKVGGRLIINNNLISFKNASGYIEGDEGINFPKRYIWYNSVNTDYGVTVAIAEIPLCKVFRFRGCFLTLKSGDLEVNFSSLNGLRISKISKYLISLRKGRYLFKLYLDDADPKKLLAPKDGKMHHYIHEAIKVKTGFELFKGKKLLFNKYDIEGSLERVEM